MMVTAGDYVLVMSATGQDVQSATKAAYRRLDKLSLPNSPMWRTDIGTPLAPPAPGAAPDGVRGITHVIDGVGPR